MLASTERPEPPTTDKLIASMTPCRATRARSQGLERRLEAEGVDPARRLARGYRETGDEGAVLVLDDVRRVAAFICEQPAVEGQALAFMARFDPEGFGFVTLRMFLDHLELECGARTLRLTERFFFVFDEPSSSRAAMLMAMFILGLIVVSSMGFILATEATFQVPADDDDLSVPPEPMPFFFYLEAVCILIFSVEYVARAVTVWNVRDELREAEIPLSLIEPFLTPVPPEEELPPPPPPSLLETPPPPLLDSPPSLFPGRGAAVDSLRMSKSYSGSEDEARLSFRGDASPPPHNPKASKRSSLARQSSQTAILGTSAKKNNAAAEAAAAREKERVAEAKRIAEGPLRRTFRYLTSPLNLVDAVAIVPFYVGLAMGNGSGLAVLRVLRLARVFRIFKVGKYNEGIGMLSNTMSRSAPALQLIWFFGVIGIVLLGSLVFFAERGEWHGPFSCHESTGVECPKGAWLRPDVFGTRKDPTPFLDIPRSFWFIIVAATTVGYGDLYPTTDIGKIIGTFVMVTGLLVLAFPITIIGTNFADEYNHAEAKRHRESRRREREANRQGEALVGLEAFPDDDFLDVDGDEDDDEGGSMDGTDGFERGFPESGAAADAAVQPWKVGAESGSTERPAREEPGKERGKVGGSEAAVRATAFPASAAPSPVPEPHLGALSPARPALGTMKALGLLSLGGGRLLGTAKARAMGRVTAMVSRAMRDAMGVDYHRAMHKSKRAERIKASAARRAAASAAAAAPAAAAAAAAEGSGGDDATPLVILGLATGAANGDCAALPAASAAAGAAAAGRAAGAGPWPHLLAPQFLYNALASARTFAGVDLVDRKVRPPRTQSRASNSVDVTPQLSARSADHPSASTAAPLGSLDHGGPTLPFPAVVCDGALAPFEALLDAVQALLDLVQSLHHTEKLGEATAVNVAREAQQLLRATIAAIAFEGAAAASSSLIGGAAARPEASVGVAVDSFLSGALLWLKRERLRAAAAPGQADKGSAGSATKLTEDDMRKVRLLAVLACREACRVAGPDPRLQD